MHICAPLFLCYNRFVKKRIIKEEPNMKLLTQADDYGFTRGVTAGIIDAIENGMLRNTGMFTNMPSAVPAAALVEKYPHVCFGIDFNLVSGPCISDPALIPHLVDDEGNYIRSSVRIKDPRWQTEEGRREMFPAEEVNREIRAQYDKFIELTGKKPGYLHGHSISPETYNEAIMALSEETGVPYSMDIFKKVGVA
ncbi:MAG: ChbG/HpnK family deacetylase, partial [Clostridiales bacterium]|nr:ChbG/HpnK family deacetylase [Clostridiales bacterium]